VTHSLHNTLSTLLSIAQSNTDLGICAHGYTLRVNRASFTNNKESATSGCHASCADCVSEEALELLLASVSEEMSRVEGGNREEKKEYDEEASIAVLFMQ
jgi:hypothetical protein